MTEYTLDVNGKRYRLNEEFRAGLSERARREYSKNPRFSCWWSVASKENYGDDEWENLIHDEGDPLLTIETHGVLVPWDDLDQLEARIPDEQDSEGPERGLSDKDKSEIFGRTHFTMTPRRYEEVPEPGGDDPKKIPPKPRRVDGETLVLWSPRHPGVEHTWSAGEAITAVDSWVEWNVQKRADQPQPTLDKPNSHDGFESLCRIHDCEVIGEYSASNDVPEGASGSVKRKGKESFEDGLYGGDNWDR